MPKHKQQALKKAANQKSNTKLGYEAWLTLVDRVLCQSRGISSTHSDLKDCDFKKWFEAGMSISEAVVKAFKEITK